MNFVNQNINNKYPLINNRPIFKSNTAGDIEQTQDVQIPDLYNVPDDRFEKKSFKETVKQVDILGMVYPWLEHPLMMIGTCAGLAYGVDKFSQACGGEYEKSLLGKAAKLGDRIENSRVAKSDFAKQIFDAGKSGKNWFNKITKNSDVINAIRTTPSMPEWSIVKDELLSQEQRIVREFTHITDTLGLGAEAGSSGFMGMFGGSNKLSLNKLGLTKEEKELVKNISNNEEAVNTVLLKRLGRSEADIQRIIGLGDGATSAVKNEILNEMGLTKETLEKIKHDTTGKYVNEVKTAAEKVKNKVWVGAGNYKLLGPVQPFERKIGCDEICNRLHSMSNDASTASGKFMSKFLQRCHRGFTFGGGKLGVLMFVAPHLVETMIDTKKADPDAKVGTVANGVISAMSWVFTFPLGLKIMHSLTGAQYAGMGKDKVQQYRDLLNEFNTKVKSDYFKTEAEYKAERKVLEGQLKALKKVEGQNLLTKMCRKIGSFLTMDLERIKSYRNGSFGGNTARKLPSFFRNLGGVPMRLILWGGITMGVLDTAITKGTKAIFGNFYDRMKEEEHEANKKAQKKFLKEDLKLRMIEAQRKKLEAAQNAPETNSEAAQTLAQAEIPSPIAEVKPQEILAQEQIAQPIKPELQQEVKPSIEKTQNRYIPSQDPNPEIFNQIPKESKRDNYTYIPSQENILNQNNPNTPVQKYIPSQTPANIVKNFDNSGLDKALRRADRAEAKALNILSGNFQ